jgi:peptidoglycan/LPS O-acetylase OafA/YrhL
VVLWVPRRFLLRVCLALAIVSLGTRIGLRAVGASHEAVYRYTVCRMDALVIGAAAAMLLRAPRALAWVTRNLRTLGWTATVATLAGFVITHGFPRVSLVSQSLGYTLLAVVFAWFIVATVMAHAAGRGWLVRVLSFAPLRSMGKYSYGIYVFHSPIHHYLGLAALPWLFPETVLRARHAALYVVAVSLVSYLVALLSYHLLEKHFLGLKRFFVVDAEPASAAGAPRS